MHKASTNRSALVGTSGRIREAASCDTLPRQPTWEMLFSACDCHSLVYPSLIARGILDPYVKLSHCFIQDPSSSDFRVSRLRPKIIVFVIAITQTPGRGQVTVTSYDPLLYLHGFIWCLKKLQIHSLSLVSSSTLWFTLLPMIFQNIRRLTQPGNRPTPGAGSSSNEWPLLRAYKHQKKR
jgi:hypothetical protein